MKPASHRLAKLKQERFKLAGALKKCLPRLILKTQMNSGLLDVGQLKEDLGHSCTVE